MADLNLDVDYFDHPQTKRLIRLLGKGSEVLPLKLWVYTAKYFAESGRLTGISTQEIEDECRWWGQPGEMVRVMLLPDVEFLELDGETLVVHNWLKRQGHLQAFKERAKQGAQERWRRYREKNASSNAISNASSNTPTNPTMPTNGDGPPWMRAGKFGSAWQGWIEHHEDRGTALTDKAITEQLKRLEKMGEERAVAAIQFSLANNYTGIVEEKTPRNGQTHQSKRDRIRAALEKKK